MARKVEGISDAQATFEALPQIAQDELRVLLATVGSRILARQRANAPFLTGALRDALTLSLGFLRVRVGLIGRKGSDGAPFYGVLIGLGRAAQTVTAQRRRGVARPSALYKLRLPALAPNDFIGRSGDADAEAAPLLADFWERVMARAGE